MASNEDHNAQAYDPNNAQALRRLFDAFLPGYGMISESILAMVDTNRSLFFITALIFLYTTALPRVQYVLWGLINPFLKVYVLDSDDSLYTHIMDWINENRVGQKARRVKVGMRYHNFKFTEAVPREHDTSTTGRDCGFELELSPATGIHHRFWHAGYLYWLQLDERTIAEGQSRIYMSISSIYFIGNPLEVLFKTIMKRVNENQSMKTLIYTPVNNLALERGFFPPWECKTSIPPRPMATVILSKEVKSKVLEGMAGFLSQATRNWYKQKHLPYRWGLLFEGPPGSGKTSFTHALASTFGLPIYNLSLHGLLTDTSLQLLMQGIPEECILLIEDIDVAGMPVRKLDVNTSPRNLRQEGANNSIAQKVDKRVTLAGLLNSLDGIVAAYGRILIVTTNAKEKLDEALLRPGRVDMTVPFHLLSDEGVEDLFRQIYEGTNGLEKFVSEFVAVFTKFPRSKISHAELQDYFLTKKDDPQAACDGFKAWLSKIMGDKEHPESLSGRPKQDEEGGTREEAKSIEMPQ